MVGDEKVDPPHEGRHDGRDEFLSNAAEELYPASDSGLSEDRALAILKNNDTAVLVLERIARDSSALKSPKVQVALVSHSRSPRHISIPILKLLCTFDLMRVARMATVPADVKVMAEDTLIARLKSLTVGERLALARRCSGRIAGALLLDSEVKVMRAAVENGRLTEPQVIESVLHPAACETLIQEIAHHARWSIRRDVRIALLRSEFLSLDRAVEFSRGISTTELSYVLASSRAPDDVKLQIVRGREGDAPLCSTPPNPQ